MRVLMTADAVGGVWTYAVELCAVLARRGVSVTVAALGPAPDAEQRRQLLALPGVDLRIGPWRLEWMPEPWEDVERAAAWLCDLEAEFRPDVVHLNSFSLATAPFYAPTLVVAHSDVVSWWRAVHGCEAPPDWDRYRRRVRDGLQAAGMTVAPSEAMRVEVDRLYGPLDPLLTIPNGVRTEGLEPMPVEIPVLSCGRLWDEAKNIGLLARVAPLLEVPIAVAGDPPPQAATDLRWLGRLPAAQMRSALARAGIFCLPARYEPFGLAVLEAAVSGCALVLGDIPSLRENWDGVACFVDPDDPVQLVRTLHRLLADDVRRGMLAEAARRHGMRLRADAMARSYHTCYRLLGTGVLVP